METGPRNLSGRRFRDRHCLCFGIVLLLAGTLLWSASTVASPEANAATTVREAALGDVQPETWMTDLAAELNNRELAHIVIPGSHDTGTYGLTGSDHDYAGTQNTTEDITAALNQGIRQFDIRVKWVCQGQAGCDFFARHGDYISGGLRFSQELDQVEKWTLAPGHEKEIILLNLSIDTSNGQGDPSGTCKAFTDALGSALLTPRQLEQAYGIRDPADVTLGQLWSMPGKPRVIMDSAQCMEAGDPSAME